MTIDFSEFSPLSLARHRALTQYICEEIQQSPHERVTFARFMELALTTPQLGYYSANEMIFGKHGDFITAPEISPLFGHCIAQYCRPILAQLEDSVVLEIGAGTGRLAADVLMELERLDCLPTAYWIFEVSDTLRCQQHHNLKQWIPHLADRVKHINQLPTAPIEGVIIANEVLDALPVHLFRSQEGQLQERYVGWDGERFIWQIGALSTKLLQASLAKEVSPYIKHLTLYESEFSVSIPQWITQLIQGLKQGVIVLIDYGFPEASYYHPDRKEGNVKCYCKQRAYHDPLNLVGLQDITSHVNFTQVARTAIQQDAHVAGFTSQAAFLLSCGLLDVCKTCYSDFPPVEIQRQIHGLVSPNEMGEQCKVMILSKNISEDALLSLDAFDRRGSLLGSGFRSDDD